MKSVDNVGVTFVNDVIGRGAMNGVVNLQFGVYQFDPATNPDADHPIDGEISVACRLRMDIACAQRLYAGLGELLASIHSLPGGNTVTTPPDSSEQAAEVPRIRPVKGKGLN